MDLNDFLFYIGADTPALRFTEEYLKHSGQCIAPEPSDNVTHLILNCPAFTPDGKLSGGGDLKELLAHFTRNITVIGGNLHSPILQTYSTLDLLKNESYLAENAAITAECALQVALNNSPVTINRTPILILGWGRIAKCLAKLLGSLGSAVTISARKETDIAMAQALGYNGVPLHNITSQLKQYRIVFNTIPAMILPESHSNLCRQDCLKIDLASTPGIAGSNVIIARGLPGKMAPETAGHLIAKTILKLTACKEVSS